MQLEGEDWGAVVRRGLGCIWEGWIGVWVGGEEWVAVC